MDSDLRPVSDSAPAWPRRASRACASCRRDKIRCDGARPCAGCIKKGYSADQCVDGCDPCRRARVRCEDGKPCQRCREMQLDCVEEATLHVSRQDSPMAPGPTRTVRANPGDRAKLACTNCRRDNKKCEDQRPCSRCVARGEECIHVGRGPKLVKLRCEACRQDSKRCEDARPCGYCVENNRQCITQPRKGRGHGTRVKAACVNCRRDKIRCDGVRPCASCVRKGLECVERACKNCSREGRAADCTHRKAQAAAMSENSEAAQDDRHDNFPPSPLPEKNYALPQPPQQRLHLPPISHPPLPAQHPHDMYESPGHIGHMGPASHYYYHPQQQHMMGPGQPPQPLMQPYIQTTQNDLRRVYYPAIDPNIDNHSSTSGSNIYSHPSSHGHNSNPNQSER